MKPLHILGSAAIVLALSAPPVMARPVSYPTGWTVMQMNDGSSNSFHVHYSPTADYSVGYKGEVFRDAEWQFHGVQVNHLLHRKNGKGSQANVYLKGGAGVAYSDRDNFDSETGGAGFAGFATDWETRRWFTSYEARGVTAGSIDRFFTQKARVGVAPYIADYGDLHTWLMVQVDHSPEDKDTVTVTPLVRLFKGETLLEGGMSNQGKVLFNWIHRF